MRRDIELMKQSNINAVRTAHYPTTRAGTSSATNTGSTSSTRPTSSPTAWGTARRAWPRTRNGGRPISTGSSAWSSGTRTIRRSSSGRSATKRATASTSRRPIAGSRSATRPGPSSTRGPSSGPTPTSIALCTSRSKTCSSTPPKNKPGRSSSASTPIPWATPPAISRTIGTPSSPMTSSRARSSGTGSTRVLRRRPGRESPIGPSAADYGPADVPSDRTSAATASSGRTGRPTRPGRGQEGLPVRQDPPVRPRGREDRAPQPLQLHRSRSLRPRLGARRRRPAPGRGEDREAGRGAGRDGGHPPSAPRLRPEPGSERFLNLSLRTREASPGVPKGHVVAAEQLPLPVAPAAGAPPERDLPPLAVDDGPRFIRVAGRTSRSVSTRRRDAWIRSSPAAASSSPPG